MLNITAFWAAFSGDDPASGAASGGKLRMVGRLLKYELRATARLYFPLYLAVLVLAVLGRFSIFGFPWQVSGSDGQGLVFQVSPQVGGVLMNVVGFVISFVLFAYVLVVLGALVVHFIITLQRFWKNLMGDEGYLMFTLPVSTDALLWSKAVSVLIWSAATLLAVALSVLILVGHPVVFQVIGDVIRRNISNASWQRMEVLWMRALPPSLWVMTLLAAVANVLCDVFHLYAAMSIGHTVKGHKILASVGVYMTMGALEGVVSSFLSTTLMPVLSRPVSQLPQWDFMFLTVEDMGVFADALGRMLNGWMLMILIVTVVFMAVFYLVCRYVLNTQLNLE